MWQACLVTLADRSNMTADEFFLWTETLPEGQRYELLAGEPVAMSPESNCHVLAKLDCALGLRRAVRRAGVACTVFGGGASVIVDDFTVYEPDVTVQCGGSIDLDAVTVSCPSILVEVLSPSTRGVDTGLKLVGYFQLPSVVHYLVLDPEKRVVTHHRRSGDKITTTIVREERIRLDPPGITLETIDLFASVAG